MQKKMGQLEWMWLALAWAGPLLQCECRWVGQQPALRAMKRRTHSLHWHWKGNEQLCLCLCLCLYLWLDRGVVAATWRAWT